MGKSHARGLAGWPLILGLAIAACGDGSDSGPPPPPAAIGTLAYVLTTCHEDSDGAVFKQSLLIRQGENVPVTVMETPSFRTRGFPSCANFGVVRAGWRSVFVGGFHRLGVSPDGSIVVFEVSDDFSPAAENFLSPEQEGFFVVRADGSGLRPLGPASRNPSFRFGQTGEFVRAVMDFSPSGRAVVFTDRGPGPAGEAIQVVTMDVRTGERTQVTHLPVVPTYPSDPLGRGVGLTSFLNERTIAFYSAANPVTEMHPDGLNPGGDFRVFVVNGDGSGLSVVPLPAALPGGTPDLTFSITGAGRQVGSFLSDAAAVNPAPPYIPESRARELFITDGENLLQLTRFGRVDTGVPAGGFGAQAFLSADGQRVFFTASADPEGKNPTETCQLFSIDSLGADLQQVTFFRTDPHSEYGCWSFLAAQGGCFITVANEDVASGQDAVLGTLVFYSSCDPFGTTPNGGQLFAIEPDGSGLRQLTSARGMVTAADGNDVELPGPFAYGPHFP